MKYEMKQGKKSRSFKQAAGKSEKKTGFKPKTKPVQEEEVVEAGPRPSYKDFYKKGRPSRERFEEPVEIDENLLFGRNSVMEALKGTRTIDKIMIQKGEKEGSVIKIIATAKDKGIVVQEVEKTKLDELTGREKHQGVVAYVAAHEYVTVDEILETAKEKGEQPFVLILDNIQDPHNLGAIIRTAHNAGVHGIIIPKRRAVGLTGTVSKSSAGALEYMKVAKVSNIVQTLKELKEKGLWIACADMDGRTMFEEDLTGPMGIVVGSEGEGVSKLTKANCDYVISVPMYGQVTSLNASVAASLMVYEVVRQRNFKA